MLNRKQRNRLRKAFAIMVLTIIAAALFLGIIIASTTSAQAESRGMTIVNPGEMVFVKLNTKTADGEVEVMLIEFDERGKGAIIMQFDQSRIIGRPVSPGDINSVAELDGVEVHYFKTVNNFLRRTDFDQLMKDIDAGKVTAWDKVKSYAKQGGAFVWDKTKSFTQWMDETAESMADYAREQEWDKKVQDTLDKTFTKLNDWFGN